MPNPAHGKVFTLSFSQISKKDIALAGGKGANLGEMYNAKIPVPNGFVVTAQAYYYFIEKYGLKEKILKELNGLDVENSKKLQLASDNIIKLILKEQIPEEVQEEIKNMYHGLCGNIDKQVAVRSSATAEDLPEASFAGQQETYLNITSWRDVVKSTKMCWASLFGARAIYYRARQGFDHFKIGIAVPIQLMIQSEVSGIMFTINPLTNNKDQISIEAAYGLGQPIVSCELTPDQYFVSKNGYKLEEKYIIPQTWQLTQKGRITISRQYQKKQKLEDSYIIKLAHIGKQLEDHYGKPQDIEWGLYNKKLYIVQTRPVTTIGKREETVNVDITSKIPVQDIILEGSPASPGYASGKVTIIHSAKELSKIKQGNILVTEMTNPDFVPAMRKASAIVTDEGGVTSHAAIVSRELGIPAVVGTRLATSILKNSEVITVNGYNGQVYSGDYAEVLRTIKPEKDYSEYKNAKTATKVYVNLGEMELAQKVGQMRVNGIGLLRAEFMIAGIGKHPRKFIEEKKQKVFIDKLVEGLKIFVEAFEGRPVIYRATDFKTNEYRSLKGGEKFEGEENNPMIGFRGVCRYLADSEVFKMEIEAIKIIRNKMGYKNLHLMLPFVRTTKELIDVKKLLTTFGLTRKGSFELYLMVEIPSVVILLDDFIDVGIDGISIGSNDLAMLILGVDRDNEKVSGIFSELDPAVLWALKKTVTTCARRGISCGICGQAPSDYPDLVEKLVTWGIDSISVNPDAIARTREIVYNSELKLLKKKPPQSKTMAK